MFKKIVFWKAYVVYVLANLGVCRCQANQNNDEAILEAKFYEAEKIANAVLTSFYNMFAECVSTTMPSQQFAVDNLQKYIYHPARTTVGFQPKFTSNRKFFANMISTAAFKEMLAKDEEELRKNYIRKLKYCDQAVMDQELLKDFYDREVDQSKI